MTETQMDVSKAGLDWKDFPEKERSQGSSGGPTAEPDGPCHWSTWKKPTQCLVLNPSAPGSESGEEKACLACLWLGVHLQNALLQEEVAPPQKSGCWDQGRGQMLGWQIQMLTPPEKYRLPQTKEVYLPGSCNPYHVCLA